MSIKFVLALAMVQTISMRAVRVLIALYALKLGATPFTIGALAATFAVLPTLLSWPAGRLADRYGARKLLVIGAGVGGVGMLAPYYAPGIPALFIASILTGLSFTFFNVMLQNLVGLLSAVPDRAKNFGNLSMTFSFANFIGPLVAGFSIDNSGYAWSCIYIALLTAMPIPMLVWGGVPPQGSRNATAKGGIRAALAVPGMKRGLVTSNFLQAAMDFFQFYMPIYGRALDLSPTAIGVILAMAPLAGFIARFFMAWLLQKVGEQALLTYSFFLAAAAMVAIPLFDGVVMLTIVSFLFGLGMGCGQPIITLLIFSNAVEGGSGEALGIRLAANNFTSVIGPVIFGSLGSALGVGVVFWATALMLGVGGHLSRHAGGRTHGGP